MIGSLSTYAVSLVSFEYEVLCDSGKAFEGLSKSIEWWWACQHAPFRGIRIPSPSQPICRFAFLLMESYGRFDSNVTPIHGSFPNDSETQDFKLVRSTDGPTHNAEGKTYSSPWLTQIRVTKSQME